MLVNLTNAQPQKLAYYPNWRRIWIQVQAGTIRIGSNSAELTIQTGPSSDGIALDAANANPFIDWWVGELWAIANTAQATAVLETPGKDKRTAGVF